MESEGVCETVLPTAKLHGIISQKKYNPLYLKMEAENSSETLVHVYQITRRYIQDENNLHIHHCDSIKSQIPLLHCSI
jgi:hypothetical protein